jgi:hypothetical protein
VDENVVQVSVNLRDRLEHAARLSDSAVCWRERVLVETRGGRIERWDATILEREERQSDNQRAVSNERRIKGVMFSAYNRVLVDRGPLSSYDALTW